MKKIIKILIISSFFTLISINILTANIPRHTTKITGQDENSVNSLSAPKVSAVGEVTSLWNYSFANTGSVDPLVAISGNGEYILATNLTTATLFHRSSNSTRWVFNAAQDFRDLALSNDGKYIVICTDRQVFLLNNSESASKTEMWKYPSAPGAIHQFCVDISSTGQYIAVGNGTVGGPFGVQLYDYIPSASKQPLWNHQLSNNINDIAISGNGKYIVAGGENQYVTILATNPKSTILDFDTSDRVRKVAISYDGKYAVASNLDKEAYLFNSTNPGGKPMWNFISPLSIESIDISSHGQDIVVGNYETVTDTGNLYYFNNSFQSGNKLAEWSWDVVDNYDPMLWDVELSGLGEYIVLGTSYCSCYLFNSSKTNPKTYTWKNPATRVFSVGISYLGDYFVFSSSDTDTIYLYHHEVPISEVIRYLLGDDDDDDDDEPAIPYGNYYLGFMTIATIALIIIIKRKVQLQHK